ADHPGDGERAALLGQGVEAIEEGLGDASERGGEADPIKGRALEAVRELLPERGAGDPAGVDGDARDRLTALEAADEATDDRVGVAAEAGLAGHEVDGAAVGRDDDRELRGDAGSGALLGVGVEGVED